MEWRGIDWDNQLQLYELYKIKGFNFPIIDMDCHDMSVKLIQVSELLHLLL